LNDVASEEGLVAGLRSPGALDVEIEGSGVGVGALVGGDELESTRLTVRCHGGVDGGTRIGVVVLGRHVR
jgi:hypothetical protein